MHSAETVERVLELREQGLGARRISRLTGVSVRTVTDWLAGRTPRKDRISAACTTCGAAAHRFDEIDAAVYSYLLGMYLGDGYIAPHPKGVHRLRISLDPRYAGIIDECQSAITQLLPRVRVSQQQRSGPWGRWVEVGAYSKSWPCLFPQAGPGKKHERPIEVTSWQIELIAKAPQQFLRGLIQSDGCRFENTGRDGWRAPRYAFNNLSDDIIALFCWACELLDLRWTESKNTIYVSRKADVARMDEFIGPKR